MKRLFPLIFILHSFLYPAALSAGEGLFDLVLRGGLLVDGSGGPPFLADVGFRDGRVAKVGDLSSFPARRVVDVTGKVVIPGIMDLLCHNDLLWNPAEQKKALKQGVTFGLVGNCGFSLLNVTSNLQKVEKKQRLMMNVGAVIGHGSVREFVMGKLRRDPTAAEMTKMRSIIEQGLKEGAFGLSSGLGYEPGEWSRPEELEDLSSVLTRYPHAVYYTHIRNFRSDVLPALTEAVRVAEKNKVAVVIQHLLFKMPANWDQADAGLRLLETARARGLLVWATVYPYDFWGNEVKMPLQQFLFLRPGSATWSTYLKDPSKKNAVMSEIEASLAEYGGGHRVEITQTSPDTPSDWLGLRLDELAAKRGLSSSETVLALMLEKKGKASICYHGVSEEVLVRQIQCPFVLFGSDSAKDIAHPRNVGAFPRLLSTYVRDRDVIRLSEMVERLTRSPARLLGLTDRGQLKVGFWGDAVVLDYQNLADRATPVDPWESPQGVELVVVNGQVALEGDRLVDGSPGRVLRRTE
jgi:N-acyl-D-amino-acid deacylase